MDAVVVVSTGLAAVASALSAVSAFASWRSTRLLEGELEHVTATTRYELFRSFEDAYSSQYSNLWDHLGPWEDPLPVDPAVRRTVHDCLQSLASIRNATELSLIHPEQSQYLAELFLDWLRLPQARMVWDRVFRLQADTWPIGFVEWVDAQLPRIEHATEGEERTG